MSRKVLMCPPDYFRIEYKINPWMDGIDVDKTRAYLQWKSLKSLYESKLGLKVELINPDPQFPDMVFTADQGLINGCCFIKSNFRFQQRRKEADIFANWFKKRGIAVIELPDEAFFEGQGDSLFYQDKLLAGFGFRSSPLAHNLIKNILKIKVVSLRLVDSRFYHLDTALCVLDKQSAIFYPQAFSWESQRILRKFIPNLIEIGEEDACEFICNSVVVNKKIVTGKGAIKTKEKLQSLGYKIFEVDLSEFKKSGGGAHCLVGKF